MYSLEADTISIPQSEVGALLIGDSFAQSRIVLEPYVHRFTRGAAVDIAIKVTKPRQGMSRFMGFGATPESLQCTIRRWESSLAELNGILITRVIGAAVPITFVEAKLLHDGSGRMIHCICHISEVPG